MIVETKNFEAIPDQDGDQIINIPAGYWATFMFPALNPIISVSNPIQTAEGISFDVYVKYQVGNKVKELSVPGEYQQFSYSEIISLLATKDLSDFYNPSITSALEVVQFVIDVLAGKEAVLGIYDILLQEVSWLKGNIREVGTG